uniref:YtkR3 n=2 Tax=unclassified Streptomyces TaxID=2593676 RepID=I3NN56_9ACTN|nr:YtkR3 [Streptomyces sp. TP-A2060]
MLFDAPAVLPPQDEHPAYLERIVDHLEQARRSTPEQVLKEFLGAPADPATLQVDGVHHVAVYAGDYVTEDDFDNWLASIEAFGAVRDVRHGPSYIAPRLYGTPGHWINLTVDGYEYELFNCRARGEWATFSVRRKTALMSHHALSVNRPEQVLAMLDFLGARPGIEQLAYTPADEIGHTYGHLQSAETGLVLEVVYAGAPAYGAGPGHGAEAA